MTRAVALRKTSRAPAKTVVVFDELVQIQSRAVPLKLVRQANAKRLRLQVAGPQVRLSMPMRTSLDQALSFLKHHEAWVLTQLDRFRATPVPPLPVPFETATLLLAGRQVPLTWSLGNRPHLQPQGEGWVIFLPEGKETRWPAFVRQLIVQLWEQTIRQTIAADFGPCVAALGRVPQGQVRLRQVKSVWGTLSSKDQVMLDIALAMAPPAVLRYVWIHELCHLRERNHSARFWAWVVRFCPEWKQHKHWLKLHGAHLKAITHAWLSA